MTRLLLRAWYRTVPLLLVALFGIICFLYSFAPSVFFRPFYPLEYEPYVAASSARHTVDPLLVAAVIKAESNWEPTSVSSQGAQGLMQLMPETAQDMVRLGLVDGDTYDPRDLDDPATNIEIGCAYLAYLIDYFHGSIDLAIAAYNAGLTNARTWSEEDTVLHNAITFPETQAYLIRVNNAWTRYRELYAQDMSKLTREGE